LFYSFLLYYFSIYCLFTFFALLQSDQFGSGASKPSQASLALTLAAAGFAAGAASGKPGMSVASIAAGAAVGLGLFGTDLTHRTRTHAPHTRAHARG
jgi:hypothetical protein